MEKKELIFEIVGLYDRITQLEEENRIFRIKSGLEKLAGSDAATLSEGAADADPENSPKQILLKEVKNRYFKDHLSYHLSSREVIMTRGNKEEGIPQVYKTFEQWYAGLGVEDLLSYDTALLKTVSLRDIKKFFAPQLKQYYNASVEECKKELEEKEES